MKSILIIGCGDIATRLAPLLHLRYRLFGLVRNSSRLAALRSHRITPLIGDLDYRHSLISISGLPDIVLHFAPPSDFGENDMRTRNLLAALSQGLLPKQIIYISTSGVYGDCGGARINETHPPHPLSSRARRRLDAENRIRHWAQCNGVNACILRVPGIYANNRLPLDFLREGYPSIISAQDSYTNHIHADDLARIVVVALRRGKPNRIYHASDDSELMLGDYFDSIADKLCLPRPPRLPRDEVKRAVSPSRWSFMEESRRLTNKRIKEELQVKLRYPTVANTLFSIDK
jgi:nucleoside-diphosphate-sugar epimerase